MISYTMYDAENAINIVVLIVRLYMLGVFINFYREEEKIFPFSLY